MTYKTQKMFSTQWEPKTLGQHALSLTKAVGAAAIGITAAKIVYLVWFVM